MIFLQLPIWFALYNTLRYSLGLRQAEFLYISDLTRPDRLFPFSFPGVGEFSVPFLGEYFNLLPILYVILTLWNQKMQPKPEDPQMRAQFRMMTFMMVFFGFIFYSFPSGFMLYIMTSSALGIIESKIIKAKLAREDAQGGGASPGAPGGDGGAPAPMYPGRKKAPQESKADGRMPGKGKGWRKGASKGRVRSP
jgi:YidC/Oxa1 family membrane protein insertase